MPGWTTLENLIREEIVERREEGCDPVGFEARVAACGGDEQQLMAVYADLCKLTVRPDFPYNEPNELADILALATKDFPDTPAPLTGEALRNKLYGAWLGRCIGCALGKPFECGPYVGGNEQGAGWEHIIRWFKGANAYPINGYAPAHSAAEAEGLSLICEQSQRENIAFMETDDDIRYLVVGLMLNERYGGDFTPEQVCDLWMSTLPAYQCCTAERQAYVNFLRTENNDISNRRDYIRTHLNPYREWIGAQIRADHFGYVHAGYPLAAAKTAYNDAAFTHVKNGIYGEMFMAAVIAAAFTESDPERCVEAGLSVIPTTSRLYEDIRKAIALAHTAESEEALYASLWAEFGHYSWVHTNNNAAACAAVLIYGKGDFTRTVAAAVTCGWDTDCNGATVGSIMGALCGADAIPEGWKTPLNDTLYSFIPDFHPIAISECADRSAAVYRRLHPAE
ncbi:MAG: ADP-ribosylglycohydrolase family protein [Clostridia bacterium]|nr:ADP-ribosylglycohydrolase family protein [Clostridia bacterium]